MALQVGELFASFTVDTKAAELALERMDQQASGMLPRFAALGEAAVNALGQALSGAAGAGIGSRFAQGLAQGIASAQESVAASAQRLGANAAGALKNTLSVRSPSRVTREIGESFDMGLLTGMRKGAPEIGKAAGSIGLMAADMLRQAMPVFRKDTAETAQRTDPESAGPAAAVWREAGSEGISPAAAAQMMAAALSGVTVQMDGAAVGSLVAPTVSQTIAQNALSRRYGAE
ncbi:MAG: hypothetical protein IJ214_12380 [Clostridia bacterium]|nr:hypothetical protein [Clostridia bacterium]